MSNILLLLHEPLVKTNSWQTGSCSEDTDQGVLAQEQVLFTANIRETLLVPCLWELGQVHVACSNMWRRFTASWHLLFENGTKVKSPDHSTHVPQGCCYCCILHQPHPSEVKCRTGLLPLAGNLKKVLLPQDTFLPSVRNL